MEKIIEINGDLFDTDDDFILHGCNCQGVMGSGVARIIKEKFPDAFKAYKEQEKEFGLNLGAFSISYATEPAIVNLLTQEYFGTDGKVYASPVAIRTSIDRFLNSLPRIRGFYKLSMPFIGCGLGGLDWRNDVRPIIEEITNKHSVIVRAFYL